MNDATIELLRDFGGEIKEALAQMAQGLGVAAEHVYIVLVKQQVVFGIIHISWPILAFIAAFFITKFYVNVPYRNMRRGDFDGPESEGVFNFFIWVGLLAISVGWVVLTVLGIMSIVNGVGHILNPEYYALRQIIDFIDQIKNGSAPIINK